MLSCSVWKLVLQLDGAYLPQLITLFVIAISIRKSLRWNDSHVLLQKVRKNLLLKKLTWQEHASAINVGVLLSCTGKQLKNYTFKFFSCFPVHNKEPFTLCCISFRRCCFGLESHPSYPINADWFYVMGMKQKNVFWKKNGRLKNWVFHNH